MVKGMKADLEKEGRVSGGTINQNETPIRYHKGGNMVVWSLIFQNYMDISKLWLIKTVRKCMINKVTLTHLIS